MTLLEYTCRLCKECTRTSTIMFVQYNPALIYHTTQQYFDKDRDKCAYRMNYYKDKNMFYQNRKLIQINNNNKNGQR